MALLKSLTHHSPACNALIVGMGVKRHQSGHAATVRHDVCSPGAPLVDTTPTSMPRHRAGRLAARSLLGLEQLGPPGDRAIGVHDAVAVETVELLASLAGGGELRRTADVLVG